MSDPKAKHAAQRRSSRKLWRASGTENSSPPAPASSQQPPINYAEVLDHVICAVIVMARDGSIRTFNRQAAEAAQRVTGRALVPGASIYDYARKENRRIYEQAVQAAWQGSPVRVERRIPHADGSESWWELSLSPIADEIGHIREVCLSALPIDERKRSEEALRESKEYLTRLKECFLSFGPNPEANINRLTAFCGETLGATCAVYSCLDRGLLCSVGQWQTPPDFLAVDKPEGHICYDVIREGRDDVFVVRDLLGSPYARTDPNVLRYRLHTYVGKAVRIGESHIGSLCAVYQRDYQPT